MIATTCAVICGEDNVLCYEPNPKTINIIRENFKINNLNVELRQRALSTAKGSATFYFNDNIVSSSLIDQDFGGATDVECDDIAEVVDAVKPTVIVMDVEGAEIDLLPAANLTHVSKIFVEMHPNIVGKEAIDCLNRQLEDLGFVYRKELCRSKVAFYEKY